MTPQPTGQVTPKPPTLDSAQLAQTQAQSRQALRAIPDKAIAASQPMPPWHVLEIGFGQGLHFLTSWQAWREQGAKPARFFYTAISQSWPTTEHWPALARRWPELQDLTDQLTPLWRGMMPGMHRLVLDGGGVQLTVCVGETEKILHDLDTTADVLWITEPWASSGHGASNFAGPSGLNPGPSPNGSSDATPTPRRHPWPALSRLCRPGTQLCIMKDAAASLMNPDGAWRQAGFALVESQAPTCAQGANVHGCVNAVYQPSWTPRQRAQPLVLPRTLEALVIGAGLSGSAVAHSLALRGWSVTVIDQGSGVGSGASGLPAGLAAPHVSPDDSVLSRISRAGVRATLQRAQALLQEGSDWALSGVLEHRVEGKRSLPSGDAWPATGHAWSTQASEAQITAAGLAAPSAALWHAMAGWIRPRQLVAAQLQTPGISVAWDRHIQRIERDGDVWSAVDTDGHVLGQAPLLVLAGAYNSRALLNSLPGLSVPLNPLRGQISYGTVANLSEAQRQPLPPFPVNGHGSFIHGVPSPEGLNSWYIGSTFERNCTQAPVREADHAANQLRLATLLPELGQALKSQFEPGHVHGWAGLRCTLPDRLPAIGPVDAQRYPGLWISTGMGARGISLAVLCGELMAAWLHDEPPPLAPSLAKHLKAQRFVQA